MSRPRFRMRTNTLFDVNVEEFIQYSTGEIIIVDDAGEEFVIQSRSLGFSLLGLEFHRRSGMPVLRRHFVDKYFATNVGYTASTIVDWCNVLFWDAFDAMSTQPANPRFPLLEELGKIYIDVYSDIYRIFIDKTREYMMSVWLGDCLTVHNHPKLVALREETKPTPDDVSRNIATAVKLLKTDPSFTDNLSRLCKIGAVRVPQVVQSVHSIGFRSDADGSVFRTPIAGSYLTGLNTPFAHLAEACTSKIAAVASGVELKASQYAGRKSEIALQRIMGIRGEDCGSNRLAEWYIPPKADGDFLSGMLGIWYITDSGEYDFIRGDEEHLYGKTIKIRTSLSCYYPATTGHICAKCYGKISESHHRHYHTGYISSSDSSSRQGQGQLSKKHAVGTATVVSLNLDQDELRFVVPQDTNEYLLTAKCVKANGVMYIPHNAARGLGSLLMRQNFDDVAEESVSSLEMVWIEVDDPNGFRERVGITMSLAKNNASLSYEMLRYIARTGGQMDSNGNYAVDLSKWDHRKTAFVMPAVSQADADDQEALYDAAAGRVDKLRKRGVLVTPAGMMYHIFSIQRKSGSQLSSVATTMLAILGEDPSQGKFNVGVTGLDSYPITLYARVFAGSAGSKQAFERQHVTAFDFRYMLKSGRQPAPLDVVMAPWVLNRYYNQE